MNPGFVNLGLKLGKEKLFSYIEKFGFGKKTGIDLNGESSGIMFDIDEVGNIELATTSFGQGISVTPIGQITAVSASINGGYLYKPYVVKRIIDTETNTVIKENEKELVRKVISESTSKEVRRALESVVVNGTGRNAYIEGVSVGGKTGTAQKVNNGTYMVGNYILSFIGFAPTDNPEIVVYVAIDNPKGVVQYGGTVAAPMAKEIISSAVDILNIESDNVKDKNYNWNDIKYYIVPNVIGLTKEEALKSLSMFEVDVVGSGIVIDMSIEPGEKLKENGKIRIMLN